MSQRYLVVLDFPAIKHFVFGTDRLVEIRGASALLDQINRKEISDILKMKWPSKCECVFVGGGAGQFIIEDSPENIRKAFETIQGRIYQQSGGALRVVTGIAPLEDDYSAALGRAFLNLKKNKQENPFELFSPTHTGFIRECESCSGMVSIISSYAGSKRYLCETCAKKEEKGQERGLWDEFTVHLQKYDIDPEKSWKWRPDDFEKIGERCEERPGYTAVVYGDGNSMGKMVKRIGEKERFKQFSNSVDEAVREACYEALWRHCKPVKGKIPADILLLGGDDLIVYLSAETAMPFALEAARLFEEKTRAKLITGEENSFFKNILGDNGLTISLGIAYGRSHTPISIMVDQAEELLKSAKQKGASLEGRGGYTPACIDFHLTSRYNRLSVADTRKHHLTFRTSQGEQIKFYQGPYTLEDAEALLQHARHLKESGIPASRLHRLGEAPFKGKIDGTIETLTLYDRCQDREFKQKQAIHNALDRFGCWFVMPWQKDEDESGMSTVMVDLVEISEFIKLEKEDLQDASSNSA